MKECYFYLDSTPTHSYLKALYKYPQAEFPYARLVEENRRRGKHEPEFELSDTGIFDEDRYFDVFAEYAKAGPDDILIRITVANRGPEAAPLHLLPTLWFRNTWIWGCQARGLLDQAEHQAAGEDSCSRPSTSPSARTGFVAGPGPDGKAPRLLFTENETNTRRLFGAENWTPYVKDAFHEYLIHGRTDAVNPGQVGTKAAALYRLEIPAGGEVVPSALRLAAQARVRPPRAWARSSTSVFRDRHPRGGRVLRGPPAAGPHGRRSAASRGRPTPGCCGASSSITTSSATGSTAIRSNRRRPPAAPRAATRTGPTSTTATSSPCPTSGSIPWYAAWDLAFHMIPFARIDPDFAKQQLVLFLREWYMHPNGQLPAYEFNFGDVNPPVHAWACWRVYKMTGARGAARPRVPVPLLPEAGHQLHLVGQPQGPRRPEPLRRRLPRAGQHRRVRPLQTAADRRPPRAGRRHGLDGLLLRDDALHRAGTRPRQSRPRRTWPPSSSSTSSPSPTP